MPEQEKLTMRRVDAAQRREEFSRVDTPPQRKRSAPKDVYERALAKYHGWEVQARETVYPAPKWKTQCIVCVALLALLLGIKYLPLEAAQTFTQQVRAVATASFGEGRLEAELGKLEFVSSIVPEAVLVFWNRSGEAPKALEAPLLNGKVAKQTSTGAWFLGEGLVHAGADGKVVSVERSPMGGYVAVLEYAGGLTASFEPLTGVRVAPGEEVRAGQSFALPLTEEGAAKVHLALAQSGSPVGIDTYFGT